MKKVQITASFQFALENSHAGNGSLSSRKKKVSKLIFLDQCTVSNIKKLVGVGVNDSYLKSETLSFLRNNDSKCNGVSCLIALMEKASNISGKLDEDGLVKNAISDIGALNSFFKNAKVLESEPFVKEYVHDMQGIHPEIQGHDYHIFLNSVNDLQLFNTIAPGKRLDMVKRIIDKSSDFDKMHPLVLTSIASVYGCMPAKGVIKWSGNHDKFKSSNALGDIQCIARVATVVELMNRGMEGKPGGYDSHIFVTDDKNLRLLYDMFHVENVDVQDSGSGDVLKKYRIRYDVYKLFPDLYDESGVVKDKKSEEELKEIFKLLGMSIEFNG